ncbi:DnaJ-domain-containing protein [Coemansia reversa NRRL 1564]|uniref:DnaJ-domain-containing protein n=1 Tax=Coemansia reversa (strain ATCC 12441 / NRRL 1564) TaxID=763665 RepID=A0A2G5BD51_COERN|nr:DnaJ-domain-containing protein [Coemansia reversa NRRL 1564]|eukprot:PIA16939.1 DnaJ-domain-containing protein [Coemansia reversa NRRL 1564]
MDAERDVYELLGVSIEASEKELARAYRTKALQYHPDKNRDNPSAVQLFHDIKAAYDLLIDPQQRSEYNEKRRAQLAKRQRQNALSGERKRMKSQLERDEHAAKEARTAKYMREQSVRQEAARFREESLRDEWRQDKKMREHIRRTQDQQDRQEQQDNAASAAMNDVDELDRTIRIRWDDAEHQHNRESLAALFSEFGALEEVVVAPVSENARRRGAEGSRPRSALLVFHSIAAAHALMNMQHESAEVRRFERTWAKGTEPRVVRDIADSQTAAAAEAGGAREESGRGASLRIPDISAIDQRQLPGSSMCFADFEALTLMRMRQHGTSEQNVVGK